MLLSRIRIRDFQSIASLDQSLPANTVFVGETDSGKSAILRAINTVFTLPRGDLFVRDNAQSCEIHLHFTVEQGEIVVSYSKQRKTSAQLAIYYPGFQVDPTKSKIWNACQELPPEIEALGIAELKLDQDTYIHLNLADQLEQPFLLSNENLAAKVLGRLSFVDRVNTAMRKVNSDLRKDSVAKPILERDVQSLEKRAATFAFLPDLVLFTGNMQAKEEVLDSLQKQVESLPIDLVLDNDLIDRILQALSPTRLALEILTTVEKTASLAKELELLSSSKAILDKAQVLVSVTVPSAVFPDISQLDKDNESLLASQKVIKDSMVLASTVLPLPNFMDISSLHFAHNTLSTEFLNLKGVASLLLSLDQQNITEMKDLQGVQQELETLKKTLGTCPTCARAF